ncbi:MAG: hypothetical protein QM571_02570 [Micrococcaceae bacterium]
MGNSFPVVPIPEKGYNRQEVDSFIEKARSSYQGLSREVTVETVMEIYFEEEVGGYDFDAVDTALDRLEVGFKEKFGDSKDRQTTEEIEPLGVMPDAETQAEAAADFEDLRTGSVRIIDGDAITKATKNKEDDENTAKPTKAQESLVEPKTEVLNEVESKEEPKTEVIEEAPTSLLTNPLKLFKRKPKKEQKETVVSSTTAATPVIDEPKTEVIDKAESKEEPKTEIIDFKTHDGDDESIGSEKTATAEKASIIDKRAAKARKSSVVEEYDLPELPEIEEDVKADKTEVSENTDPNINMNDDTKTKVIVNPESSAIAKIEVIDDVENSAEISELADNKPVKVEATTIPEAKPKKKKKAKAIKATLADASADDKKTGIDKDTALNHIVENVQKRRGSIPGEPEPFKEEFSSEEHTAVTEYARKVKKKAVVADLNKGASVEAKPLATADTAEKYHSGKTAAVAELATIAVGAKDLNKADKQPKDTREVILARFNRGNGKRFNKASQTGYKVSEVDRFAKTIADSMQNGKKLSLKDIKKTRFSSARSLDAYSEKQVDAVLNKLIEVIKAK